jgi:hypothetical protein
MFTSPCSQLTRMRASRQLSRTRLNLPKEGEHRQHKPITKVIPNLDDS